MVVLLAVFHVLVAVVSRPPFALDVPENLFAVIGVSALCCLLLLSLPLFRRPAYELFLRGHHALAIFSAYAIWRHLPSDKYFPRCYLYIAAGLFLAMCIAQCGNIFYQNGFFRYSRARAQITHESGAVKLRIRCYKPIDVKAGQHINLWIPSVSFWSMLQSHPFVVISWAENEQEYMDLFIEPRRGLTRQLLSHANNNGNTNSLVLFSGPHGKSIPMSDCENILMVASGFGIAAHLPYLKQLIHGYNARQVCARRIHLVWQVRDIDVTIAAQPLLNDALNDDTLDDGWILAISIYCESSNIRGKSFGKRAKVYPGKAPLRDILQAEVRGDLIEKKLADQFSTNNTLAEEGGPIGRDGKLLVTVSSADDIRDELRSTVREHLRNGVSYFELEYQPPR
ncbi:hypothetical protein CC80DRAFT_431361 [Byssothecium circinans]|uniref:ferric-chelate reductase (NADPH) n=1 Tax=Byssothecium circinans TaxID=147558 RepID=A0A6A5T8K9_9PLEO|nr:hypothetical protein CC80DRAFT_431361 [Byssothecium circinans]